jgi:hypothetical protein
MNPGPAHPPLPDPTDAFRCGTLANDARRSQARRLVQHARSVKVRA